MTRLPDLSSSDARSRWVGGMLAAGAAWSVLALVAAPAVVGEPARQIIMAGFSAVCHQIAERSPHVGGVQLAVCDRCLGIYAALAAAPLLFAAVGRWDEVVRRHARYVVALAIAVPAVDWAGDVVGWWVNTPESRMATGSVFGLAAGWLLTSACINLVSSRRRRGETAA